MNTLMIHSFIWMVRYIWWRAFRRSLIKSLISSGELKFLKKVESPWKVHYYVEKYERLKWHVQFIDRLVPDFCETLQNINEPWYPMTSNFKKDCPFEAGYIEAYNHVEILKHLPFIPITMIGKYRATIKSFFIENGSEATDCTRIGIDVIQG